MAWRPMSAVKGMANPNTLMFPVVPTGLSAANGRNRSVTEENTAATGQGGAPLHLLFIDDHALLRDTLAAWLAARGLDVTCVDSPATAFGLPCRPDLVLLDLRLRDLTLPEGICKLRSVFGPVPVLLTAGAHDAETAERARDAGVTAILGKALPPAAVLDEILRHAPDVRPVTSF